MLGDGEMADNVGIRHPVPPPSVHLQHPQQVIGKTTNQGKILATKDKKMVNPSNDWQNRASPSKTMQIRANSATALWSPPTPPNE